MSTRQIISILLLPEAPKPIEPAVLLLTAGAQGAAISAKAKDKVPAKSIVVKALSREVERANEKRTSTRTKLYQANSVAVPCRDALRSSLKSELETEKLSEPTSSSTERTAELLAANSASRTVEATAGGGAAADGVSGASGLEPSGEAAGSGLAKGAGRGAATEGEQLVSDYLALVWKLIKKNWHPVKTTLTHTCTVKFRIKQNGSIENVRVVRSSGADDSDQAAISAVRASSPLPPLPEGVNEDIDIKFDFDYTVLKRE